MFLRAKIGEEQSILLEIVSCFLISSNKSVFIKNLIGAQENTLSKEMLEHVEKGHEVQFPFCELEDKAFHLDEIVEGEGRMDYLVEAVYGRIGLFIKFGADQYTSNCDKLHDLAAFPV